MQFLNTEFGKLAYEKVGNGKSVSLFFHGFGQNSKVFQSFRKLRESDETYLFIDLFYHGHSAWKSINSKLTKEIWREILIQLMQKEDFGQFHLVGYSMGGKFSLITFELFPEKVKSMVLMALDGIKTGLWYNMAAFPLGLKKIFKSVIFHPDRFFALMDKLHQFGLLESSLIKFVKSQMQTRTMRAQLYFTWIVFKPLKPDLDKIIKAINIHLTPVKLITGQYDKMVTSENLQKFSSKIPHLQNIELPCGHNQLIEETVIFFKTKKSG